MVWDKLKKETTIVIKALVIDDEAANVELLKEILRLSDCAKVVGITDPTQATKIYTQEDFDIVLLDLNMPHLSGFDVLAQLKDSNPSQDPKVVLLTGDHDPKITKKAMSIGVHSVLTKPFSPRDILRLLDELKVN